LARCIHVGRQQTHAKGELIKRVYIRHLAPMSMG